MALWLLAAGYARADGCFVFVWDKAKDINEPTPKAILLHDQGREDLVLQVKYEGPAEEFGWLVPVPGLPEVRQGSIECFYELSRLTQERWREGHQASQGTPIPEDQLARLLASTNLSVVAMAASQLRGQEFAPGQLEPLLTNSLPLARLMGLGALTRVGDKAAVQRIVAMLHDPNEGIRWRVRSSLRQLSGQKLGPDPAAWERWWATNQESFTPQPRPQRPGPRR